MSASSDLVDAIASAAFQRYAEASTRFQKTHRPADALAARRAFDHFARVFLTPDELAGIEKVGIPVLRRDA